MLAVRPVGLRQQLPHSNLSYQALSPVGHAHRIEFCAKQFCSQECWEKASKKLWEGLTILPTIMAWSLRTVQSVCWWQSICSSQWLWARLCAAVAMVAVKILLNFFKLNLFCLRMKDLDVLIDVSWFHFDRPIRKHFDIYCPTYFIIEMCQYFWCCLCLCVYQIHFPRCETLVLRRTISFHFLHFFTFSALWGNLPNSCNVLNISTFSFRFKPNYLNKESVSSWVQQCVNCALELEILFSLIFTVFASFKSK